MYIINVNKDNNLIFTSYAYFKNTYVLGGIQNEKRNHNRC